MNKREFKDKIYGELAQITKAMANPRRLEIIEFLAQGEYSVEQISIQTNLSYCQCIAAFTGLKNRSTR